MDKLRLRKSTFVKTEEWEEIVARISRVLHFSRRKAKAAYFEYARSGFSIFCNGVVLLCPEREPLVEAELICRRAGAFSYQLVKSQLRGGFQQFATPLGYQRIQECVLEYESLINPQFQIQVRSYGGDRAGLVEVREEYRADRKDSPVGALVLSLVGELGQQLREEGRGLLPAA